MSRSKAPLNSTEVIPLQVGMEGLYPDEVIPGFGVCGEQLSLTLNCEIATKMLTQVTSKSIRN